MARYVTGEPLRQGRLGLFPAAFNPPTIAHVALAEAAAEAVSLKQVALVLPQEFPHKKYEGTTFEERLEMLRALAASHALLEAAVSRGGLFIEVAREFRELCGLDVELYLLCGRDAAERIVAWDYGDGPSIDEQLQEYAIIAGSRNGPYQVPEHLRDRIHALTLPERFDAVSSTAVREAMASGGDWEMMTPPPVAKFLRQC